MFKALIRSWQPRYIQRGAHYLASIFACHDGFAHSALNIVQGDVKLGFRAHSSTTTESGTFVHAPPTWVSLSAGAAALRPLASTLGESLNAASIEGYDGLPADGRRAVDAAMKEASAGARDPVPAPFPGPCRCKSCATLADYKTKRSAPAEGDDDESETASAITSPVGGKAVSPKKKTSSSPSKPAAADAAPTPKAETRPAKKAVS